MKRFVAKIRRCTEPVPVLCLPFQGSDPEEGMSREVAKVGLSRAQRCTALLELMRAGGGAVKVYLKSSVAVKLKLYISRATLRLIGEKP